MKLKYLLPLAVSTILSIPTQAAVLISEVLYDAPPSTSDTTMEWVELYNSGCSDVDLSTYTLADNQATISLSGIIKPGAYFTFARGPDAFTTIYGFAPNATGMTLSLGNSGDYLTLKNGEVIVDFVGWEGTATGGKPNDAWSVSAVDLSIYRLDTTIPATTVNWVSSTADTPGTGGLIQDVCTASSSSVSSVSSSSKDSSSSSSTSVASSSLATSSASSSSASLPIVGTNYTYDAYYAKAMGLGGSDLRNALQTIIKTGHVKLTYAQVWTALQYTDEDPNNTNNVILIYTGRSEDKNDRDGQPGDTNDSWNREHVWAKSYGFPNENQFGYTDINHLRPADKTVNSSRGNKAFDNGGSPQGEAPDTFTDSDSWEPRDQVKGDVARMIFYMDVRYDGKDGNMPDLVVVDNTDMTSGDANIGKLCTLFAWNKEDPVDSFEARRNNRVFELQGNRNPFIDNPAWVDSIWEGYCEHTTSSSSSSSSSSSFSSSSVASSVATSSLAASSASSAVLSSSSPSSASLSSSSSSSATSSVGNSSSGGGAINWLSLLLLAGLCISARAKPTR